MQLRVGSRWRSAVDETQVVVIRAPEGEVEVTCGGYSLVAVDAEITPGLSIAEGHGGGTVLGKRYIDPETGVELLCSKAGAGALFVNGEKLQLKSAKPLPASD
ncbi:hypothetical protein [Nocardia fusca]|uniref:hypothetical protein n=1 Tax=Nocardia fusca TaxID=941183 RepID=UPI0007A73951|nr:hypothetical protein [Nocardia fusca]